MSFSAACTMHPTRQTGGQRIDRSHWYRSRTLGIRYSSKARREIVHRRKAPVTACRAIVHIFWPGIDDALALLVGAPLTTAPGNARDDGVVNLLSGGAERREVVGGSRQALARRLRQIEQRRDRVGHRHERDARIGTHEARVRLAPCGGVNHLRRVVGRPTRRHGHRGDQTRKPDAAEVDAAGRVRRSCL